VSDVVEGSVEGEEEEAPREEPSPHAAAPAPFTPAAPLTERRPAGELVRTQAAAVAATGFAVGAVTAVALSRRRTRKAAAKQRTGGKGKRELANVVASRSFLVDVHLLGNKGD